MRDLFAEPFRMMWQTMLVARDAYGGWGRMALVFAIVTGLCMDITLLLKVVTSLAK
jgi:hypothetical protein